jgi:peptidoglycan/LPS O-acetylase OafA/YrhL
MMNYRADIDGLRGVAVLLVLLFHAGLPFFPGGFIGVDVFFVISGYLITAIIVSEAKEERFSYLTFYERRARRILPALYVMASIVLLVTLLIQVPSDLLKTSKTLLFALLFSSNVFFWRTTDYFSGASDFEFFLHTWSLGVEEQFYFIFPLVILLLIKRGRWLLRLTVLALVVSLAFSVYTSYHHEWASYYLLPSRAWQMMMGAILAIAAFRFSVNKFTANVIAISAILLIALPAIYYTKQTRFPGAAAFIPTLGAALIIFIGGIQSGNWVTKCLGSPVIRFVGLISYSLYLWHWPIFAFLRNYQADVDLDVGLSVLGIVASFFMAYLSWRYVEAPFRNKQLFSRKTIFRLVGLSSVLLLGVCVLIIALKGAPSRIDPTIVRLSAVSESGVIDNPCMTKSASDIRQGNFCGVGDAESPSQSIVLWGDSHLGALRQSISTVLEQKKLGGVFFGKTGCPPMLGVLKANLGDGEACLQYNQAVFEQIEKMSSVDTVVLHARWALSVEGSRYGSEGGPNYVLEYTDNAREGLSNVQVVALGLERTVKQLMALGKRVIVIAGVPEVGVSVPKVLVNNMFWGKNRDIAPSARAFSERQLSTNEIFKVMQNKYPALLVVHPSNVLCDERVCHIAREGEPLYFDDDHLSDLGAGLVVEQLIPHI